MNESVEYLGSTHAVDEGGNRINPLYSGQRAMCECCKSSVVAKCGDINTWHWAHESGRDCDPWSEPITPWHRAWQKYMQEHLGAEIEVVIRKGDKAHRADAVLPNGIVVEVQSSHISPHEISERESFYGRMIWVFDCGHAWEMDRLLIMDRGNHCTFRWKHARKSVAYAKSPVRLCLGDGWVFNVKKIHIGPPCAGWGVLRYVEDLDGDGVRTDRCASEMSANVEESDWT